MKVKNLILIAILPVLAFSCTRKVEYTYETIPLVDRLMEESLTELEEAGAASGKPEGVIVLAGDPMDCLNVSEMMLAFDEFDNVGAKPLKDGLPDFAGETVVSILDFSEFSDSLDFRGAAVKAALASIDSTVSCKVLVLCTQSFASKGADDVRDLFERIGCDVPVIAPGDTVITLAEDCFKAMREKNVFTHNIAYPSARLMVLVPDQTRAWPSAVPFEENLVPEVFADTVSVFAPNTYVSHVQNKHISGRNR